MSTEDTYLRSVDRMLRGIAPEHRTAVLDDLRGHFADAADAGRSVDEVVRGLGTPREIAERAHEEFGTDATLSASRAERAFRVLQGAAVGIAVVTGVVAAFIMPSYGVALVAVPTDGTAVSAEATLFQNLGLGVALIALIPALIAAAPLFVPRRARVLTASLAGAVLTAMALIGGFTLGGFFLPTALLTWAALIAWVRLRGAGFGIGWRIAGGVLAALPVIAIAAITLPSGFGMQRRYADQSDVGGGPAIGVEVWGWLLLTGVLVLAALMIIGYRTAGWALAAVGLLVLISGLISGGLVTLLFIWVGGWWLTIGLAHAVTATRRRA